MPLAFLTFIACSPKHRAADVTDTRVDVEVPGAEVEWYEIEGDSRVDLLASLLDRGPRVGSGNHVVASTNWSVHWHIPRDSDGTCKSDEAYVTRSIVVQLPAWRMPQTTSQAEQQAWTDYVRSLAGHEWGHVRRVHAQADALVPAIRGKDCEQANKTGYAILDDIQDANATYDIETQYGGSQGVEFWTEAAMDLDEDLLPGFMVRLD